ncbi:hypothetical protein POPTR_005G144750v4 [Populus trichocarpa]|uniref:Uncharacterized protein n=1 Tax=Populus trichocarpa TaxID=3694 RepID=A0ACC0SZU6_POPTR|nr:hypothetical protein POPTR_005G144750v4 [Populus trichocarpa]
MPATTSFPSPLQVSASSAPATNHISQLHYHSSTASPPTSLPPVNNRVSCPLPIPVTTSFPFPLQVSASFAPATNHSSQLHYHSSSASLHLRLYHRSTTGPAGLSPH